MINMIYRDVIKDQAAVDEFENLVTRIKAFLSVAHNEDGTLATPETGSNFVPVGTIVCYAGSTAPLGWLVCDGSQVSRTTYIQLFTILGTLYGAGNGTTTFNLPDLQQRFPLGKSSSGTGSTLGDTGGLIDHIHGTTPATTSEDGEHDHDGATSTDGAHTHSSSVTAGATFLELVDRNLDGVTVTVAASIHGHADGTTSSDGNHSHSISADGGHTHSVDIGDTDSANPPFQVVNFIILAGV